jgi:predicted MPP superfamily phosphohydrolase
MKPFINSLKSVNKRATIRAGVTRRVLLGGLGFAGLLGSATAGYAAAVEPFGLVVTSYRPRPSRWPCGCRLSITVIADLHAGGPNMAVGHIRHVVNTANALKSDVIVLLGDYIASHHFVTERVPEAVWGAELARLEAPLGVWAVLGNHDWWSGVGKVQRALADARIGVLENHAVRLGADGRRFWLAGLGDQMAKRLSNGRFQGVDDLPGTLAHINTDDPAILLAHEPDIFSEVPDRIALTLAGHTHGGQIRLPFVSGYRRRFAYGHVVETRRHLIVSGGLGTSVVPLRLGVPPEIVRVDLGA